MLLNNLIKYVKENGGHHLNVLHASTLTDLDLFPTDNVQELCNGILSNTKLDDKTFNLVQGFKYKTLGQLNRDKVIN